MESMNKLKQQRERFNLTQEQLADRSGVSQATISSIENGTERNPKYKTLAALAAALQVTIDEII